MKIRFMKRLPLFLPLALTCGVSSCIFESERACPDRLTFTIVSNWDSENIELQDDAAYEEPEGMAYLFFPDDGGKVWRFDFPGREAGKASLSVGDYKMLSFNDDTQSILFRGEAQYDTFEAYTPEKELLSGIPSSLRGKELPPGNDERVVGSPDMMWGCSCCRFSLGYDGLSYVPSSPMKTGNGNVFSPDFILTVNQRQLTARYTYRIENVENLSGVKSMSAAISGMAGSMMLASGRKCDYPSTIPVMASIIDSSTIGDGFCTFGIPTDPTSANILSLFIVIKDGRRFCYRFDVTDQVRQAPDPMDVEIVLKGLKLEIPENESGSGFDVIVDGWETSVVNITV